MSEDKRYCKSVRTLLRKYPYKSPNICPQCERLVRWNKFWLYPDLGACQVPRESSRTPTLQEMNDFFYAKHVKSNWVSLDECPNCGCVIT